MEDDKEIIEEVSESEVAVGELPYFDSLSNLGKDDVTLNRPVETMTVDPLKEVTKDEFEALKMHIKLVVELNTLNSKISEDCCSGGTCDKSQAIEPLKGTVKSAEKEVWTKMANKFGFNNIEQLAQTNLRFRLRSGYFIEAYNG